MVISVCVSICVCVYICVYIYVCVCVLILSKNFVCIISHGKKN